MESLDTTEEVECEARIGLRLRDDAAGERLNAIHSTWVNSGWILQESDTERRITIEKMTYLSFEGRFLLRCDCDSTRNGKRRYERTGTDGIRTRGQKAVSSRRDFLDTSRSLWNCTHTQGTLHR